MQVYLATAPKYYREASSYHHRIAHAAYRIGIDSRLLRQAIPMSTKGGMKVKNVNEIVQEVLDVTGFSDILTIE